jgi:type I restriction enzyme S subunit
VPCFPIDTTYFVDDTKQPCHLRWLYYGLLHLDLTRFNKSAAVPGLNRDDAYEQRLLFPSPPEQQRIAELLDSADRLRRVRRYALQMCDELLPSVFLEMFGTPDEEWPTTKIAELAEQKSNAIRTGPFGSQLLHSEFTNSGIAVLGIDNAVNNRFEWAQRRYITPQKYEQLRRYTVFPGDVVITIMGTCGRCAVIPDNIPLAINTKHLCCMTLDQQKALPSFIHAAFLYHPRIRHQLGVAEKGAIMEGLNMGIIEELSLPLPPLSLQQAFAKCVEQHELFRATLLEALRQAEHLFQTLLHQAFSPEQVTSASEQKKAPPVAGLERTEI